MEAIGSNSEESNLLEANKRHAGVGTVLHALRKVIHEYNVAKATPAYYLEGPTETLSCLMIQTAAIVHL